MTQVDVAIVGGGIVGLSLACALAARTPLSILLLEANDLTPHWELNQYSHRVSAITLASQRIFSALQVWPALQKKRVSPFNRIEIWDQANNHLHFDSAEIAEAHLGYIIENELMQQVLLEHLQNHSTVKIITSTQLIQMHSQKNHIELITSDHNIKAKLVVGADGAESWLRKQAGIQVAQQDYHQSAIVCTVRHGVPHQMCARQIFLEEGPLAFLPLADANLSSIVWTQHSSSAPITQKLSDKDFSHVLGNAFQHKLGEIIEVGPRFSFPLAKHQAKTYIGERLVLVGDAAHRVHPLAGQGVNMGLFDMACLTDVLVEAIHARGNFASVATLRRYERWRKMDNLNLIAGIDLIYRIFHSNKPSLVKMGFKLSEHLPAVKNIFTRYAVGEREKLPSLVQCFH